MTGRVVRHAIYVVGHIVALYAALQMEASTERGLVVGVGIGLAGAAVFTMKGSNDERD